MAGSLKDQLIQAGLAPNKKKKAQKQTAEIDLATAYRQRKQETQRQKQNKKHKKLAEEKRRREVNRELKVLVEGHAVRDPKAAIGRNFVYRGRIRKVLVNPEQLAAVNSGALVIVYLAGSYHLLPAEKAVVVKKIAPDHLPDLSTETSQEDEEFPVPDDLVW